MLATPETLAIMRTRYGDAAAGQAQPLAYGEAVDLGDVTIRLVPAGHVLGSAQVVLDHAGQRIVVSGDYKRRRDPTCPAFEPVACDVFVTEATYALPVFRHPDDAGEIATLLASVALFPERAHMVGAYGLGKAQRPDPPDPRGRLGEAALSCTARSRPCAACTATTASTSARSNRSAGRDKAGLAGEIVLAPPGALTDRWSRRLPDPVTAMASGWMRVRQRAKQRGVELPLIISDHADWDELTATLEEVGAPEIWVTHGREEALVHWAARRGIRARALSLIGREDEDE